MALSVTIGGGGDQPTKPRFRPTEANAVSKNVEDYLDTSENVEEYYPDTLIIEPDDYIEFQQNETTGYYTSDGIHLVNPTRESFAYKVKTTDPFMFRVHPRGGISPPRSECFIEISCNNDQIPIEKIIRQKLLVEFAPVENGTTVDILEHSNWNKLPSEIIKQKKLRVVSTFGFRTGGTDGMHASDSGLGFGDADDDYYDFDRKLQDRERKNWSVPEKFWQVPSAGVMTLAAMVAMTCGVLLCLLYLSQAFSYPVEKVEPQKWDDSMGTLFGNLGGAAQLFQQ